MKNLITTIYLVKSFIGIILLMTCFISLQSQIRLVDLAPRTESPNSNQVLSPDVISGDFTEGQIRLVDLAPKKSFSNPKAQIRLVDVISKESIGKKHITMGKIRLVDLILKEPAGKAQIEREYLTISAEPVYPNPAIDQITIPINVLKASNVYLNIFDANGRLVDKIFDGEMKNKGLYNPQIDLSNHPKGIYYYSITTENQTVNGKFIKL